MASSCTRPPLRLLPALLRPPALSPVLSPIHLYLHAPKLPNLHRDRLILRTVCLARPVLALRLFERIR